jgi:hypothetical protein
MAALLHLLLGGLQHEDQRTLRETFVVAMDPDPRPKRVVEPELVAARRVDPAAKGQT